MRLQWHQLSVQALFEKNYLTGHRSVTITRNGSSLVSGFYFTDSRKVSFFISEPVAGNQNNIYDIDVRFKVITATLEEAQISGVAASK